ncbi:nucleotidyltransferase domain-containing protein [Erythrobacter sp. GH1-10]|uniref:nucleotidyltransferase domain-containing protein n=1 Tax=Erythrobacter sp. GH1-10 TaxID=3349334 RepID=UPI003877E0DE
MKAIEKARDFSDAKIEELRSRLGSELSEGANVVTCGSFARRDATSSSDLDYFCLVSRDRESNGDSEKIKKIVQEVVGKAPSDGGAFAQDITESTLLSNIGGYDDDNQNITRRVLYLLEGEYLTDRDNFERVRRDLIRRYVESTPDDHQIAFYLLNDIVRYWRTITVDYAHKTTGSGPIKPWGVRNLKLVYSRKLIYASAIFSVALTADRSFEAKCDILEFLFSETPINRLRYVCGDAATQRMFELYDTFVKKMDDADFRKRMDALKPEEKGENEEFRHLKNEGHYFSRELMSLLQNTFHSSHPIHMALIF